MAAASRPTALHVSLILSVMVTIILGVVTWMYRRDYNEALAREKATAEKLSTSDNARAKMLQDQDAMKAVIGHQQAEIGGGDQDNPATVVGQMRADIQTLGGDLAQATYHDTLVKLRQELDAANQQVNSLNTQWNDSKRQILSLQGQYQVNVDEHQRAALAANSDLQAQIKEKQDITEAKDAEIAKVRGDHTRALQDLDALTTSTNAKIGALQGELAQLQEINNDLRDKLEQVTMESFEVADGVIRSVDHNTNLVWINLGKADGLLERTTFSVYMKNHQGVGRGPEDIKGAIEVTNVTGPHLAEARILDSDLYRPIAPGDPIYTPLWSPNQVETFSIVGLIDFDGDGVSDRDRLHELIAAAGAKIDNEVDDVGNRTGDGIDVNTKFLVMGDVPDPTKSAAHLRDEHKLINQIAIDMRNEARLQGVRQVNLNSFLDYIGYRTTERLWLPGGKTPWTLRAGERKTGQDETVRFRGLGGRSSGVFQSERRTNQPIRGPQQKSAGSPDNAEGASPSPNYNTP
jgi:hypothetical protein